MIFIHCSACSWKEAVLTWLIVAILSFL